MTPDTFTPLALWAGILSGQREDSDREPLRLRAGGWGGRSLYRVDGTRQAVGRVASRRLAERIATAVNEAADRAALTDDNPCR